MDERASSNSTDSDLILSMVGGFGGSAVGRLPDFLFSDLKLDLHYIFFAIPKIDIKHPM